MKKLLITSLLPVFALLVINQAQAAVTTSAGVYYSFKDHAVNHVETVNLVSFKDVINLEGGYAGDADKSDGKVVLALSADIKQLALKNYIKFPILDLIALKPAFFVGAGQISKMDFRAFKMDYGIGATCLSVKW